MPGESNRLKPHPHFPLSNALIIIIIIIIIKMCELQAIYRKTRTLSIIFKGLHPKSDVDILYIPRKGGGRDSITIEDCVELAIRCLEVYVHGSQGRMI